MFDDLIQDSNGGLEVESDFHASLMRMIRTKPYTYQNQREWVNERLATRKWITDFPVLAQVDKTNREN